MFRNKREKELTQQVEDLLTERDRLNDQCLSAKNELAEFRHKKKMEEEDLKHMMKIKEEGLEIQLSKKEIEMQKELDKKLLEAHEKYRDKAEIALEAQIKNLKEMYGQILNRLPNINAKIDLNK